MFHRFSFSTASLSSAEMSPLGNLRVVPPTTEPVVTRKNWLPAKKEERGRRRRRMKNKHTRLYKGGEGEMIKNKRSSLVLMVKLRFFNESMRATCKVLQEEEKERRWGYLLISGVVFQLAARKRSKANKRVVSSTIPFLAKISFMLFSTRLHWPV